ncbi:hypothetical protein [Chelatococcus asaccharovorans]|nr:hypothetical protein [Chelatococcus asaccharovorans]
MIDDNPDPMSMQDGRMLPEPGNDDQQNKAIRLPLRATCVEAAH